jgi:hypothetical protein
MSSSKQISAPVLGCGCLVVLVAGLMLLGTQASESPSAPSESSLRGAQVQNASLAKPGDVQDAENFLNELPAACGSSSASAGADGAVTIRVVCSGNGKAMDGTVRIKDGIVTDIR